MAAGMPICRSAISYVQCQNLKYNVIIVGWLGVIISGVVLCSSLVTMHWQPDIEPLIKEWLVKGTSTTVKEQQFLMNLLTIFSTIIYGLSLINILVSLLLLIAVARDCPTLLYPWLVFHAIIFGAGLYLTIFYATLGIFIDLTSFLLCLLVSGLILVVLYKIYYEVFTLFHVMRQYAKIGSDAEQAYNWVGLPYETVYMPRPPYNK